MGSTSVQMNCSTLFNPSEPTNAISLSASSTPVPLLARATWIEEFGNNVCFPVFNRRDLYCGESPGGIQHALDDFHSMFPEPSHIWKDQECVNYVVYVSYFLSHMVNCLCMLVMTSEIPFGNYHSCLAQYRNYIRLEMHCQSQA